MNFKKNKSKIIKWVLFYSFLFCLLLNNSFRGLDPDYGWHNQIGKEIIETKTAPSDIGHSFTLVGKKWIDHEWATNALMHLIDNTFGYIILNICFSLLVILILGLQNYYSSKYIIKRGDLSGIVMFLQLYGVIAMSPHLGVRVQELSILFLLLELMVLHSYSRTKSTKKALLLIPLFILWANTHAGFILGFCVLLMWCGLKLAEKTLEKTSFSLYFKIDKNLKYKHILLFFLITLIAGCSTVLTPYGFKLMAFLGEYFTNTFYLKNIKEWLPSYYWPIQYHQLVYAGIVSSVLIINTFNLFYYKNQKAHKINLWNYSISLLFILFTIKSKRHFTLLYIVSFPLILEFTSLLIKAKIPFKTNKIILNIFLLSAALFSAAYILLDTNFTNSPELNKKFCSSYPCDAISFMKKSEELSEGRTFNNYGWGGFIIKYWPEKKLFIDGRLPQYEFNGHSILEEYLEFFDEEKLEEKLEHYDIRNVLYKKQHDIKLNWIDKNIFGFNEDEFNNVEEYLKDYLESNESWEITYEDNLAIIYKKK